MVKRFGGLQADCKLRYDSIFQVELKILLNIAILLFGSALQAQTPIGLYEGLLGNSGAALTDASAPSFYNPSLLARKANDSYAISGNTFGSFSSKSDSQEASSVNVYPSYLSSIFVSESLVHEIFLINLAPSRIKNIVTSFTDTATAITESNREGNKILLGYSMAFRKLAFALSYFVQYSEIQEFGFAEYTETTTDLRKTSITKGSYTNLAAGLSVSGYTQFNTYTLGYNLKLHPAVLYTKNKAEIKNYIRGESAASDYRVAVEESQMASVDLVGTSMIIGHSFRSGEHEFITDTLLAEKNKHPNSYELSQSFGYRLNSGSGHQFLCGLNHGIGGDVRYFGQNLYLSTGYSWINKINRSTVGLYFYRSKIGAEVDAAGLTFGSEFSY